MTEPTENKVGLDIITHATSLYFGHPHRTCLEIQNPSIQRHCGAGNYLTHCKILTYRFLVGKKVHYNNCAFLTAFK
jgi:hypothetical protein